MPRAPACEETRTSSNSPKQGRSIPRRRSEKALPMSVQVGPVSRERAADTPAKAWLRALERTAPIAANPARTLPAMLDELAERHGDAPALLNDDETLSYRALAARANRYARW